MPCYTFEGTETQKKIHEAAKLLVAMREVFFFPISDEAVCFADSIALECGHQSKVVSELCTLLKFKLETDKEQFETWLYDGRDKLACEVATWWEEHQERDRKLGVTEDENPDLELLKKIKAIHPWELVGDISQDLLLCSYNEDDVRELWNNNALNDLYRDAKKEPLHYNTSALDQYDYLSGDFQTLLTIVVGFAGGWPDTWGYSDDPVEYAPFTEQEQLLLVRYGTLFN